MGEQLLHHVIVHTKIAGMSCVLHGERRAFTTGTQSRQAGTVDFRDIVRKIRFGIHPHPLNTSAFVPSQPQMLKLRNQLLATKSVERLNVPLRFPIEELNSPTKKRCH